jgi:hypothetical protein
MRSRLLDGVVIVLLGLALFTAAVHALPPPPDLQAASVSRQSLVQHLGSPGRAAPHEAEVS